MSFDEDVTPPEGVHGPKTPAEGSELSNGSERPNDKGPSNRGNPETRIIAAISEGFESLLERLTALEDKTDVVISDLRKETLDRREGEKLMLMGIRHGHDAIAGIRAVLDADHEGDGKVVAWIAEADHRIKQLERQQSVTNEVALDALSTFAKGAANSERAREDRRALMISALRAVGHGVSWIFQQKEVKVTLITLVVAALGYLAYLLH